MAATYQFRARKGLEISCGRKNNIPQHPLCKHLKNEWRSGRLTGKRLVCGLHSMDQRVFLLNNSAAMVHHEHTPRISTFPDSDESKFAARANPMTHPLKYPRGKGVRSLVHLKVSLKFLPWAAWKDLSRSKPWPPQTPCLMNVLYNTKLNKWWSCPR